MPPKGLKMGVTLRNYMYPKLSVYESKHFKNLSYAVLFSLLIILYSIFVVPNFSYSGYSLSISLYSISSAYAMLLISLYILPPYEMDISTFSIHIIFIFSIMPLIIYSTIGPGYDIYAYASVSCFIITCLLSQYQFPLPSFAFIHQEKFLVTLLSIASITLPLWLLLQNGVPGLTALDLSQVYSIRGTTRYGGSMFVYLVSWLAKVFNPFLLGYAVSNYKILPGVIGIVSQITVYLFTAHKLYLFTIVFVFVVVILLKCTKFVSVLVFSVSLSSIFAYLSYLLTGSIFLPSITIRRVFFVPARVQTHYYEFFSQHKFALFSRTKIGFLIDEVYAQPLPTIIGDMYVSGASANTGYLADGYAQAGFVGLVLVSVALGVLLSIFNSISITSDAASLSPVIIPIFILANSALTTTMLTHGLIIGLIIFLLYAQPPDESGTPVDKDKT